MRSFSSPSPLPGVFAAHRWEPPSGGIAPDKRGGASCQTLGVDVLFGKTSVNRLRGDDSTWTPAHGSAFLCLCTSPCVNGRIGEKGKRRRGRRREERGDRWLLGALGWVSAFQDIVWSKSQALIRRGPKTQTVEGPMGTSERKPLSASGLAVQRAGVGQGTCLPLSGHRFGT